MAPKKQKKAKKNKEDAQFVLRLDRATRDYFVEICAELDTTAAHEIRRFIKQLIRRDDDGEMDDCAAPIVAVDGRRSVSTCRS